MCLVIMTGTSVFAQSGIKLDFKQVPLQTVLESISKQSKYKFVYTNEFRINNYTVTINSNNENLKKLLSDIFSPLYISYEVKGDQIILGVIKKQESSPNKKNTVTGVVIEEDNGEPLPGVTVQNLTTNEITSSDFDGKFNIGANTGDKLLFSSIGLSNLEVTIGKSAQVNAYMKPDAIALSDVVVTGYQTLSKERATGSYNLIKAEQLEKPTSNIASRIIGTSAGVQTKMDENGNILFQIRGQSRLVADDRDMQPLIVVDGFPITGDFTSINPNDVENITILKDAAAASIWGAKSANGVIVITTKSGKNSKKGDLKVEVSAFWKVSPKLDLKYNRNQASSAEIIDYEQRGFSTNFFGGPWSPIENSSVSSALTSQYSLAVTAMNEHRLGQITASELNETLSKLSTQNNSDQLKKYVLDNPFTQQYNVNIAGNTGRSTQMLSLMFEQNNGNFKGVSNDRYNVGYRTNVDVFKWLDFTFAGNFYMINGKNNDGTYNGTGNPLGYSPYQMLIDESGNRTDIARYYTPNMNRYVPMSSFPYSDWSYNPLTEMESKNHKTEKYNVRAQAGLGIKIIDGLTIDSKLQYEYVKEFAKNIYNENSYFVRKTVNEASTWDRTTGKITSNLPKGGILMQNKKDMNSYNWRNQLNFSRSFDNNKHFVSFIAGTEMYNIVHQSTAFPYTYGYNDDKLTVGTFPNGVGGSGAFTLKNWLGSNQSFNYTNKFTYSTERYFSLFANASYTFKEKYTLSGSYRTDASNLITDDPKYRYAPFWSIGANWNITQEKFMKDIRWLDRLALRATYGYNGNVDRTTSFNPLININGTQNSYIQDYVATIGSYGNPSLRWEKTGSLDIGLDFAMFTGRLYGKLDFYNRHSKDLIVSMSIPSINGTQTQKLNAAEMTNRGIEIELGTQLDIYGKDITWTGGLNFSYNHNQIGKLFKTTYSAYELYGGGTASFVEGYNANTLWSFGYAGVVNKGTEANPNWQPVVHGKDGEVYDFTGWTPGDGRDYMLNMGTKVAPFSMSLSSMFKIYNFELSFILTGKFGHKFQGATFNYPSMSGGSAIPNALYNEVKNSDPMVMVPIPFDKVEERYYFWDRFYPYLDYRVQSASHIRCQELYLSYNLPQSVLKVIGINRAKFYVQGNNLFVIANNKYNEDPEYTKSMAQNGFYKPQATYTFGVNLTF